LPVAQNDGVGFSVPVIGDKVTYDDVAGSFATHNLIINGNGSKLNGSFDSISVSASGTALYYTQAAGWTVTGGTLTAVPALLVSPSNTNTFFSGQLGNYPAAAISYSLQASSSTVNYSITGIPSWLTITGATSGSLNTTGTGVTFTVNTTGVTPGIYQALLVFTNTATGQTVNRTIQILVSGKQYVAEGDSITTVPSTHGSGYPADYASTNPAATVTNNAVSASFIWSIQSRQPTLDNIIATKKPGDKFVLSVMLGTNDACFYYQGGVDRTLFLQQLAAYCDKNRAAGWYVILCTLISRGSPATTWQGFVTDNELEVLNTEFRLWASSGTIVPGKHADAICDFAANPNFAPGTNAFNNTTYYMTDLTHPTVAGEDLLATIIKPYLDAYFG
jgi:lysophospholipase L1-like esterase